MGAWGPKFGNKFGCPHIKGKETKMSKKELIDKLNQDLSAEWGTILRYTYQTSKLSGLQGLAVSDFLRDEIQDELGHAFFLSDVIVDLGGEPTIVPKVFEKEDDLREMLKQDIVMELEDVVNYTEHSHLASELSEVELKLKLEEMAADEAGHARELGRILRGL
jgi:bacterioferritin